MPLSILSWNLPISATTSLAIVGIISFAMIAVVALIARRFELNIGQHR